MKITANKTRYYKVFNVKMIHILFSLMSTFVPSRPRALTKSQSQRMVGPIEGSKEESQQIGHLNHRQKEGGFKATVLGPVGSNLTREVPMSLLGNLRTDTTHEGVTPRGEPRAWYERKVDTLPR